jgi:endonuclease/exonuclease/phosphatase family metal-dependent hydrolase
MGKLRIVFENISGGFVMAGKVHGEMVFSRVSLEEYIECFRSYEPDILSLTEVHMEDAQGHSEMVERIAAALPLPYFRAVAQSPSHLDTSKYLGLAVLSRYPIVEYAPFVLPNPQLEVDKADGSHWVTFDKGAQRLTLDVGGQLVTLFNLHYFPLHHFKRSMDEPEFAGIRQVLVDILLSAPELPTIITGDFNNKGTALSQAFPELFVHERFTEAVVVETTVVGLQNQFDHILYTPSLLTVNEGCADQNLSDHYALIADFSFLPASSDKHYGSHEWPLTKQGE